MKYFLSTCFVLMLFVFRVGAQDFSDQIVEAFSKSYSDESSKNYAQAIADLKKVYNAGSYETNLRLGWLYYQNKEYGESQNYYKVAMKLQPMSIEAMLGFVNPAATVQNWSEVFSTYQKILNIDPNHSVANYRIALMYYYRKEFTTADKHLQKIVSRYPFDYDIILLCAQVKLAMGKLSESKVYYQRAYLYNPSSTDIKEMLNKLK